MYESGGGGVTEVTDETNSVHNWNDLKYEILASNHTYRIAPLFRRLYAKA